MIGFFSMVLKEKRQEVMGLISLFDMKGIEKKFC